MRSTMKPASKNGKSGVNEAGSNSSEDDRSRLFDTELSQELYDSKLGSLKDS